MTETGKVKQSTTQLQPRKRRHSIARHVRGERKWERIPKGWHRFSRTLFSRAVSRAKSIATLAAEGMRLSTPTRHRDLRSLRTRSYFVRLNHRAQPVRPVSPTLAEQPIRRLGVKPRYQFPQQSGQQDDGDEQNRNREHRFTQANEQLKHRENDEHMGEIDLVTALAQHE